MNERPAGVEERADAAPRRRPVRSYVLRKGRITEGQRRALEELWPRYGVEPGEGPLDFAALFGNDRPVILEIGFGNGAATWRMARARPDENYLGVEVHRPGVGHLLLKIEEHGLENVRVACEDAVDLLRRRVPDASLDGVRIFFPDPWHKKRHHKRRLVQAPFVALLARRMKPGAILHIATDWAPYAEHMVAVLAEAPAFENRSPRGEFCPRPDWRPPTRYERRGERLGHDVFDLVYRRVESSGAL
ncbi:MAG: tRNA (guanosine(46)-N7)-methyltransferase TrmB [Xanthomonadales bacterium]